jgi:hypothetical protein
VAPQDLTSLHLGWNIGLDDPIADLAARARWFQPVPRDIDVVCRAAVPPIRWTYWLRQPALDALQPLAGACRVLAPESRVPREEYYAEMRRSRICVSPFGYGEVCWRDFEAVLCGCLLVKPDMGHVRTYPNLFVSGVTYVPVRWDYADLRERCQYYLAHETERARIAAQALDVLQTAHRAEQFVDAFASLLRRLNLLPTTSPSRPAVGPIPAASCG